VVCTGEGVGVDSCGVGVGIASGISGVGVADSMTGRGDVVLLAAIMQTTAITPNPPTGRIALTCLSLCCVGVSTDRKQCKAERKNQWEAGVNGLGINGEGYRHSVGKEIAEIESTPMKVKVTTLD
jgi:hypothetical protein